MKKLFLSIAVALIASCAFAQASFNVASYNLRNDNAGDAARGDGWQQRLPVVADLIRYHQFDIFGTQECFKHQLDSLQARLPGFAYIGVGRDDGKAQGEHAAIFYDTTRFHLVNSGDFWLSETPDVAGSKGWDAALPRVCSWGQFRDLLSGKEFLFFNLHMDHIGVVARVESAYLVINKMKEIAPELPAILTGDFNVDQTHQSYHALTESERLRDSYEISPIRYATNGTFNGFKPDSFTTSRIDHIFTTAPFSVTRYAVLTDSYRTPAVGTDANVKDAPKEIEVTNYINRLPSDHYPVAVTVILE